MKPHDSTANSCKNGGALNFVHFFLDHSVSWYKVVFLFLSFSMLHFISRIYHCTLNKDFDVAYILRVPETIPPPAPPCDHVTHQQRGRVPITLGRRQTD